jgi:hypothetical protein
MTIRSDPDAATAMQYLVWALEYIEKTGAISRLRVTPAFVEALRKRTDMAASSSEPPPLLR